MENTKTQTVTTAVPIEPPVLRAKNLNPEKLLRALFWVWDAFERVNMPYFLVSQTARDVMKERDLTGDKVEVGVRRLEWISGGRRILDAFMQPIKEDENKAEYIYEGIPVVIHVYEESDCIINCDTVFYRNETFKVPNPYHTFEQLYG